MAVFRNFSAVNQSGTTKVGLKPSGVQVGDVLYAFVISDGGGGSITPPSGWTQFAATDQTLPDGGQQWFYRKDAVVSAGDPASWTWTTSAANAGAVIVAAWSSATVATSPVVAIRPLTSATESPYTDSNATPISGTTTSGITVPSNDSFGFFVVWDQTQSIDAWGTSAYSNSLVERVDFNNADWISAALASVDGNAAGATGAVTFTGTRVSGSGPAGYATILFSIPSVVPVPTITVQPTNQSALIGQTATFNVTATSATSYQWRSGSVALKGTPTTGSNSSSSSNPVLNVPTGATSGDEYVVSIEYYNSPGTITAPAGFTQIATASSGVANIYTYRRVYTGTEGSTFTWTPTTQRPWAGICTIVTNGTYVTANASAQTNGFLSSGSNSAGATGSVTPTSTNQFVLAFCDTQTDIGAITASITDPTGFTRSVFNDSGQGLAMSLAYKTETSSSAVSYSYGSSWSAGVNCWTAGAAVVYQSGNPISGATSSSYTTATLAGTDNGTLYSVDCINISGTTTSNTVRLLVSASGSGRSGMFDPDLLVKCWF